MRRFNVTRRFETSQEIPVFGTRLVGVFPVAPGETVDFVCRTRIRTGTVLRGMLGNMSFGLYASYVPHRLCFPSGFWSDLIAGEVDTMGLYNGAAHPAVFEGGAGVRWVVPRRSFKLAYNHHFGSEDVGEASGAWYADPFDDAVVTERRVRGFDQMVNGSILETEYDQGTYVAPVAGASATISLGDFARAAQLSRGEQRRSMAGDRYVDQLRRFGIRIDDKLIQEPEFLGGVTKQLAPAIQNLQAAADAGVPGGSYWEGSADLQVHNKRFTEHGLVLVFGVLRHASFEVGAAFPTRSPQMFQLANTREWLFDPDVGVPDEPLQVTNAHNAATTGSFRVKRYAHYRQGEHLVGSHTAPVSYWLPFIGTGTVQAKLYPQSGLAFQIINGGFTYSALEVKSASPVGA